MSFAVDYSLCKQELSRMGKGGNRRSRGSTEENAFGNITLKKLFPRIYCFWNPKAKQSFKYLPYSFIQKSTKVSLGK